MPRILLIPYAVPFVYQYVTCPIFDHRYLHTSFNLVTGKSLYSFRYTRSCGYPLVTLLASLLRFCITEWALRYLSVIRSDKSQS